MFVNHVLNILLSTFFHGDIYKMYFSPVSDFEKLRNRIQRVCQIIRQRCGMFERVRDSCNKRMPSVCGNGKKTREISSVNIEKPVVSQS